MSKEGVNSLVSELLKNPKRFVRLGRSHELLNESFDHVSFEQLKILLDHEDIDVKKDGIWLLSELGVTAKPLLSEVINLLHSLKSKKILLTPKDERFILSYIMEVITNCADELEARQFNYVVQELFNEDNVIQRLAMYLISNASDNQIRASIDLVESQLRHFLLLLLDVRNINSDEVIKMLEGTDTLAQLFGTILAKKLYSKYPELIKICSESLTKTIKDFAINFIKEMQI